MGIRIRKKYHSFDDEANPKQYGFESDYLELYIQDEKYYISLGGRETRIDGGSFNRLVEGIGGMTPEQSEEYIKDQYYNGKVKKL